MDWYRYSILTMGFLSLSVASTGLAYPTPVDFDGKLQRWSIDREGPRVTFEVLADDTVNLDSYRELAKEVAGLWSSVPAAYVEVSEIQENETAMISIHYDVAISGGDTSAGYAEFDSTDEHGPKHCTIHIAAPDGMDWPGLAKTTLHEMGHCLGLGHSVVPESIMSYRLDKNDFALALDDEAAVARLYPSDGSNPRKPAGCAIGSAPSSDANFLLFAILLVPAAPTLRRRFSRR